MTTDERRRRMICCLQHAVEDSNKNGTGVVAMSCEFTTNMLISLLQELGKGWIDVNERLPESGESNVLAVKQLKDGRRDICIARCIPDYEHYDPDTKQHVRSPYWVCGGNNNIIYWMPLPEIPEE